MYSEAAYGDFHLNSAYNAAIIKEVQKEVTFPYSVASYKYYIYIYVRTV